MSFPETGQQRRERMEQNRLERGYYESGTKRPHNNRKGGKARQDLIEKQGIGHFDRLKKLKKRGGTPVCRPYHEVAKEQDIRQRKRSVR